MAEFLAVSTEDMVSRGWDTVDFVLVTGDAYVDHPSFGAAVIGRHLESQGYRVAILAQPTWSSAEAFRRFGRPKLAFLVTAGNLDSMVANYTVSQKPRREDSFSPGGKGGRRPDRATLVYAARAREAYPGTPIILGGLEASLRRLSHYDYWQDKVRRSVLVDAKADLLVWGMGERQITEIAARLRQGVPIAGIRDVRGTSYRASSVAHLPEDSVTMLPPFETVSTDRTEFARSYRIQEDNTDGVRGRTLAEPVGDQYVIQNPPALPLETEELDRVHELPYTRRAHPMYEAAGGVPAIQEVKFSLVSTRGCFGSCSFCSLTFHQGRVIQPRSHASLRREAEALTREPDFKGYIHDVGGPTANFRLPACGRQAERGTCTDRSCLGSTPCRNLKIDHRDYLSLLRKLRGVAGVKKVFVRSGIRYDYLMAAPDPTFLAELCEHHVSGQLKVAPEHVSARVLALMGKPGPDVYARFARAFRDASRAAGKEQYLVPYLMSSHPGSDLAAAIELALFLRDTGHVPEQVQDFYPTPGTRSTCMYWTGLDPSTMQSVYVARSLHEKAMQRALIQYRDPANHRLVVEALEAAGRADLIGHGPGCLVPPSPGSGRDRHARPGATARRRQPGPGTRPGRGATGPG